MKIDEPMTPYNAPLSDYMSDEESNDGIDALKLEKEYFI